MIALHSLYSLSVLSLGVAVICAGIIIVDILYGRSQRMPIMDVVWPVTALYLGVIGLAAYFCFGRERGGHGKKPLWQSVFIGATHCGAGCALGDALGEWIVFLGAFTLGGAALWPEYIADFALAYSFGMMFQYCAIASMKPMSFRDGLIAAVKADTLSLIAYEIGMFAWMAYAYFILFPRHLSPVHAPFWFMMQIGMAIGLVTSIPANAWLIRRGIKEAM